MSNTTIHSPERDTAITREVARIRADYPYRGNYREQMAALLGVMFFKFGERVGANRLASLLAENGRSPSTSTAQDEINKFWAKVRENSAIKINRPDLPPVLLDLFSTMAGTVWEQSVAEAGALFISHRQEVASQLAAAQKETEHAGEQLVLARAGAEQALRQVQLANEAREALGRDLARESAGRLAAENTALALTERLSLEQLARKEEGERLHKALAELKAGLELATDEQRRLMTIGDEFKQQAARDRALRTKSEEALARLNIESERMQKQVAQISGERGVLEGLTKGLEQQVAWLTAQLASDVKPASANTRRRVRPGARTKKP